MSDSNVWILGGYQSDFARNLTREGVDFAGLTAEVVNSTLQAARINAADVGVVHVGNAFGEMFASQGHLGAMPATVVDGLWDTPSARHEAACASGSIAALAAIADLRSGAYETALILGVELEKTVPGDTAARYLGAAAWTGHEGQDARFMWPSMFSQVADEYDRRYGLDESPSPRDRVAQPRQRPPQPQRADPRLAGAEPAPRRRRREPRRRGQDPSLRLQPDDRRRGRRRRGHRRLPAGPPRRAAPGPRRGLGPPHGGPEHAPEAGPLGRGPVRHAPTCEAPCSTRSAAPTSPWTTSTAWKSTDCFTPSEYLAIDHVGADWPWRIVEGNREREIESADGCRSTPAAG